MPRGARIRACDLLSGRSVRVDVVAQATAQAWTEYDTMVVHQAQAYGPGSVHAPLQLPKTVRGLGGTAAWIPARRELVATNSTPTAGGSYITVNVTRTSARRPGSLALARAIARAMLVPPHAGRTQGHRRADACVMGRYWATSTICGRR
jgi:hypothetical protein